MVDNRWKEMMAVHPEKTRISVGLVKILQSYAASMDIDFESVATNVGFDLGLLADGEAKIPGLMFEALWLKIACLGNDPYPGLSYGRQAADHYPAGSILFSMMRNCPTIARALDLFVRYHRIMADNIQPLCENKETTTHLSWDLSIFNAPVRPHLSEALLCTYYSILARLSQGKLTPVRVNFTHPGPERTQDRGAYEHLFQTPVHFESDANELIIDNRDLELCIELADGSFLAVMERHATRLMEEIAAENRWAGRVVTLIGQRIFSGSVPSIAPIAHELAVSKRSLQEKLRAESTTFRDLVQAVRKTIAMEQLGQPEMSICDVAFLLGYADQSAFNHAFRRWTGKSPKAFIMSNQP